MVKRLLWWEPFLLGGPGIHLYTISFIWIWFYLYQFWSSLQSTDCQHFISIMSLKWMDSWEDLLKELLQSDTSLHKNLYICMLERAIKSLAEDKVFNALLTGIVIGASLVAIVVTTGLWKKERHMHFQKYKIFQRFSFIFWVDRCNK